ncbi:hypothetical protein TEA_027325 [Camellia sinensis var. sinensis]|uniref:NAD(P)H dehydrogenase subunit CRR3, chloroplastic n=1 Tax=Camellia sinensis var. sinensis TaxID=542762 RepID=A0A4S4EEH9_CAMSN|nr:hypothetical protein TEA_027325 [Camellia sinensis var. sinensis]
MHSLTSFSSTKPHIIIASLSNNNPPPPHTNPKPPLHRINTPNPSTTAAKHLQLKQKQQKQKQKQPSVAEIEKGKTLFDSIFSNSVGESEGPVERKLRETGEWIIDRTERSSNSIGKNILMAVFQFVLPIWILSFLVASGIVKLPFSTPFLDDLIM